MRGLKLIKGSSVFYAPYSPQTEAFYEAQNRLLGRNKGVDFDNHYVNILEASPAEVEEFIAPKTANQHPVAASNIMSNDSFEVMVNLKVQNTLLEKQQADLQSQLASMQEQMAQLQSLINKSAPNVEYKSTNLDAEVLIPADKLPVETAQTKAVKTPKANKNKAVDVTDMDKASV